MDHTVEQRVSLWMESDAIDQETKDEIQALSRDESALTEAFYKDLEFGTGGLRGIMGVGSNRMNKYTVGRATQGLCNYLKNYYPDREIRVAIAYDSRNKSDYFARTTANVFAANDIQVFLFDALRPTPELSFAIRELNCQGGIVITASHNPKEYNGYKAYWHDGAQLVPPHDKGVIEQVNAITDFGEVNFNGQEHLITPIGSEIDQKYLSTVEQLVVNKDAINRQRDLSIVYSSIHGTGITMVPQILKRIGFENVVVVEEQSEPDGNFPTVVYPNPEEQEAMSLALDKADMLDADLIMATDPDTDRVGIGVKNPQGKFQLLNGNQTGVLILHYLMDQWKAHGKLASKHYIVKTIVTTQLIDVIADHYGVDCYNTLTGFKWIAEIIRKLEGDREFIAGGEESYGYMIGESVRDKDAVASCAIIAELVAFSKDHNRSLFDNLIAIYQEFGYYKEDLISITKPGKSGAEEIQDIMRRLREAPPATFAGSPVAESLDYLKSEKKNLQQGTVSAIDLPKSNVLQFVTEDGSKISARPSGTEPKIKFYMSVNQGLPDASQYQVVTESLEQKIQRIKSDLQDFTQ